MKERILLYLHEFSLGRHNSLADEIMQELRISAEQLQAKSAEVLSSLLHHYSQFSISTIDSFFQRVIRSFTREAGLLGNFRLEVDNEVVMEEVVNELLDELGHNEQLTQWVIQFSRDRLLDGDNWRITPALLSFSREIFKEEFKLIEPQLVKAAEDPQLYKRMMEALQKDVAVFINTLSAKAQQAWKILQDEGITKDDFSYGDQGTAFKYFRELAQGNYFEPANRIKGAAASAADWPKSKRPNSAKLKALAENQLMPILNEMLAYEKKNYIRYKSSIEILKNFYAFGLISDITRKLRTYKQNNNIMLLSDASQFLNGVINNSDTPFVYEKVGSFFRNYLIDEFQDTSLLQWQNFFPLVKEAGDQNHKNLVVGDVKQSIYRWRGGDLTLLQHQVPQQLGESRLEIVPLNINYRSAGHIVNFNNELFSKAAQLIDQQTSVSLPGEVFHDVKQGIARFPDEGFVDIRFIEADDDALWEEKALSELPLWLERLQDQGASLRDIAILVRTNREGQRIANYLLQFRATPQAKAGYRYDVVSNESLRLDTSRCVSVLLSAMTFLNNPGDAIVRAQLSYELSMERHTAERIFSSAGRNELADILPETFLLQYHHYKRLSLFELVEELIRVFELGKSNEELAYLQAFQDLILEFSVREKTDIESFLLWWEVNKDKKSIQVSGSVDAVNIITIHKSKGLQYKFVLIPFCNWKLDHEVSPLIWVQSEEKPYEDLGPMIVRYSGSLKKTIFQDDYQVEFTKANIDNLNILYVAFTRAEEGLIVMAPKPAKDQLITVGELVYQVLKGNPEFDGNVFQQGVLKVLQSNQDKSNIEPIQLSHYPSADWRAKLVIKREGTEYFLRTPSERRTKINRGILLHALLAKIHYKADASEALNSFFVTHAIDAQEQQAIREQVEHILSHKQMSHWFAKEWQVKTEVPVLLPGKGMQRLDRVMFNAKKTVIVDYKTGERKEEDRRQLEMYATVLTQMNYANVEAWLVYLHDMSVVEVVSKSSLSLF